MGDWFGVLTSGPPQALPNSAFYWADQFHYRRTYQFAFVLFKQARAALDAATTDDERFDAQTRMAFAVGWLTHCATDVTGHPFTNAKSGGPFRDHWQRHHWSSCTSTPRTTRRTTGARATARSGRARCTSGSRSEGADGPYGGREDAPAYDYFTGFPAYDNSDTPTAAAARHELFDLDTGDFPDHLVDALLDAMADVHPDGPKILTRTPVFGDGRPGALDGRPNAAAMAQMWTIVYGYMKLTGSDGLSPRRPTPPPLITDHSFPTPPGGGYGVDDDPTRGADVDDDSSFTWLDLVLAIFAWMIFIAEVIIWLATIVPGIALDLLTKWARDIVYEIQCAAWTLFILARRALVMTGFLIPKPEELDLGLTTLGTGQGSFDIGKALDDPLGDGFDLPVIDEPSGRATPTSSSDLDRLYPRNVVRDRFALIDPSLTDLLNLTKPLHYAFDSDEYHPSEWLSPWRYPLRTRRGKRFRARAPPSTAAPTSPATRAASCSRTRRRRRCAACPGTVGLAHGDVQCPRPAPESEQAPRWTGRLRRLSRRADGGRARQRGVRGGRLQPGLGSRLRLEVLGLGSSQRGTPRCRSHAAHGIACRTSSPRPRATSTIGSRARRRICSMPTTTTRASSRRASQRDAVVQPQESSARPLSEPRRSAGPPA